MYHRHSLFIYVSVCLAAGLSDADRVVQQLNNAAISCATTAAEDPTVDAYQERRIRRAKAKLVVIQVLSSALHSVMCYCTDC